jgi:DNA-binding CsgD family transcriptional regulator
MLLSLTLSCRECAAPKRYRDCEEKFQNYESWSSPARRIRTCWPAHCGRIQMGSCISQNPWILLSALRTASVGGRFFSPKTNYFESNSELPRTQTLSTREIEVLRSIAEGKSNKEIGRLLGVATKTVDNHRTRLMQKLSVHNAASLTLAAVQIGIVQASSVTTERRNA